MDQTPPEKINIHEAKTQLSRLLREVSTEGKSFIIASSGTPRALLVPLSKKKDPRQPGLLSPLLQRSPSDSEEN